MKRKDKIYTISGVRHTKSQINDLRKLGELLSLARDNDYMTDYDKRIDLANSINIRAYDVNKKYIGSQVQQKITKVIKNNESIDKTTKDNIVENLERFKFPAQLLTKIINELDKHLINK
jgi:hypothetical protein